jgi:coenzyme F420-0:L-glutamate ligase/coenzyme F420-1:gamma-L-glutamate ligase
VRTPGAKGAARANGSAGAKGSVEEMISIIPVEGIPEVSPGDELAELILGCASLENRDVVVITQKVVSKAEGRLVAFDPAAPDARRQLVLSESTRVLREREELIISETRHGFVCANAGVDFSNVADGQAALLPVDPDRSARSVRDALRARTGLEVGVIISDTFGRPWRIGVTDVAIGCAGIAAVIDLRGTTDVFGRELVATEICVADEIASAAELAKGKTGRIPVVIVRGLEPSWFRESSVKAEIVRPPNQDLFR